MLDVVTISEPMLAPISFLPGGMIFVAAALYFLLGWLVFAANLGSLGSAAIWPNAGLALAVVLRLGNSVWPA